MKKALLFLAAALMGLAANAQTVWSEDFESVTTSSSTGVGELPTGWTTYADDLTNYSNYTSWGQSWCVYNMSNWGKAAACMTYTNVQTPCDRWLITPQISIPSDGNEYNLVFDFLASQYSEKATVLVSTTGTEKANFTETLMPVTTLATGVNQKSLSLNNYAGQNIYIAFRCTTTDGLYLLVDNLAVKVMPANSLAYYGASGHPYNAIGSESEVKFAVQNTGTAPLTSYDYDITIDGTPMGTTQHVSGINIATYSYDIQTIQVPITTAGQMVIGFTISNPNGEVDPDLEDNTGSLTLKTFNPSDLKRTVLLENFTTAACQYCPSGHERLHEAIAGYEDFVVWVAHHTGYGSDNWTLSESVELSKLYGTTQTWAPAMAIDRNASYVSGNNSAGVVGSVEAVSTLADNFMRALNTPTTAVVNWDGISYNANTREVSVTTKTTFYDDFTDKVMLNLWVTEDGIIGAQVDAEQGRISNYEHNCVLRKLITPTWGDDVFENTTYGNSFSKTYTFTLPSNINAEKARLVAFIHKKGSSDNKYTDRHVLYAAKTKYLTDPKLDIKPVDAEISVNTYPNPATEMAYINANGTIKSMILTDISGRTIQHTSNLNCNVIELNVRSLEAGVYFITVTTDSGVATQKFNVVK